MAGLLEGQRHGWVRGCHHLGASLVARGFPCMAMHTCYDIDTIIKRGRGMTSECWSLLDRIDGRIDKQYAQREVSAFGHLF